MEISEALRVNGNEEKETKIMNIDDITEALLNGEDTSTSEYWEDKES